MLIISKHTLVLKTPVFFACCQVGPKQRDLKVKDRNEFEFKPEQLVSDITKIYLNLSKDNGFCKAVSGDGRSYSPELFPKAVNVLQKIGSSPVIISDIETLHAKICVRNYNPFFKYSTMLDQVSSTFQADYLQE